MTDNDEREAAIRARCEVLSEQMAMHLLARYQENDLEDMQYLHAQLDAARAEIEALRERAVVWHPIKGEDDLPLVDKWVLVTAADGAVFQAGRSCWGDWVTHDGTEDVVAWADLPPAYEGGER